MPETTTSNPILNPDQALDVIFSRGGEMGALIRSMDWSKTPLGPFSRWPASLKASLSICLTSRFPMIIFWGPELIQFYNDGYRPMIGVEKHPAAMGAGVKKTWPEIWTLVGPQFDKILESGESTLSKDTRLILERNGYPEECYFTYSYSPIFEAGGVIGGVFCSISEDTSRVLSERRLRTLRDIATQAAQVQTPTDAHQTLARSLTPFNPDLPFSCYYEFDPETQVAKLLGGSGYPGELPGFPSRISLKASGESVDFSDGERKLAALFSVVLKTGQPERIESPDGKWDGFLSDPALQIRSSLILPVGNLEKQGSTGFLVMGLNPHRALDVDYGDFFNLVAGQFTTALQNAWAYETVKIRVEELKKLDRSKTEFLSNISHEFRTPLTLILGLAEEMASPGKAGLSPENLDKVSALRRSGSRLLKLVNNLFDYSGIESGRMDACFQPTDLPALTCDLASMFRSALESADLTLRLDCHPLEEAVYVDRDMWENVILNLLSNAFKYTISGEICVALQAREGMAELQVRDTGIGISSSEIPYIFERFYRVKGAQGRFPEGTGIGLALVKQLILLHGGAIHAESHLGQGTTFTVRIPLGKAHLPPEKIRTEGTPLPLRDKTRFPLEGIPAWKPKRNETVASPRGELPDSRARILLVDDNADMRDYLQRILENHWQVETAEDGASALRAFERRPPDLILSDIMMTGMDGSDLLRILRADVASKNIPIILLSARAGEDSISEGLEQGADDYLIKPFSARQLITRVKAHIQMAKERKMAEQVLLKAQAEAEVERSQIYTLFMEVPAMIAVVKGPDHVYDFANPLYLQAGGNREIIGKSVKEAFPEVEGINAFSGIMDKIYTQGGTHTHVESLIPLEKEVLPAFVWAHFQAPAME